MNGGTYKQTLDVEMGRETNCSGENNFFLLKYISTERGERRGNNMSFI